MRRVFCALAIVALLAAVSIPPATAGSPSRSYLILAEGNALPPDLSSRVELAGGTITRSTSEIGILAARSSNPLFAADVARMPGVRSVVPDVPQQWIDRDYYRGQMNLPATEHIAASSQDDFLFDLQWGLSAIDAPGAWERGARGAGARVAVLDTGFDLDHPDLAPNINYALSRSLVPGEGLDYALPDANSHGTHVAGIIAAADNGLGVIGVAPEAELVLVKVLRDDGLGASFLDILAGIVYAANVEADVINMSLRGSFPRRGFCVDAEGGRVCVSAADMNELIVAFGRATAYAYRHGSTLIGAAGNESADLDHTADLFVFPAQSPGVVSVSGTGPKGWGLDQSTSLDVPGYYTNYGQSLVDFAAPGGNVDFSLVPEEGEPYQLCTVGLATEPCVLFDMVLSTTSDGGWGWGYMTSMAAPHVSGVAALVVGKAGGSLHPAEVEAALRRSADDLGKPGQDDYYGQGRVNAGRAVR